MKHEPSTKVSEHESAAIALMQIRLHRKVRLTVARKLKPGIIYDWADPATNQVGQCWLNMDGSWFQDPRGENPVILMLKRRANHRGNSDEA